MTEVNRLVWLLEAQLQFVFQAAYDGGPYRRGAIDYTQAPQPPLTAEAMIWAEQLLRAAGLRPPPEG